MLGPHSGADSGNPKPNLEAVAGYRYVGRSLLGGHGRKDQALDIRLRVGALIERPRILHRVCRHLDQAQIEKLPPMLDVLSDDLAARSDLRRSVSESFGGRLKVHTERLPSCLFFSEVPE